MQPASGQRSCIGKVREQSIDNGALVFRGARQVWRQIHQRVGKGDAFAGKHQRVQQFPVNCVEATASGSSRKECLRCDAAIAIHEQQPWSASVTFFRELRQDIGFTNDGCLCRVGERQL